MMTDGNVDPFLVICPIRAGELIKTIQFTNLTSINAVRVLSWNVEKSQGWKNDSVEEWRGMRYHKNKYCGKIDDGSWGIDSTIAESREAILTKL